MSSSTSGRTGSSLAGHTEAREEAPLLPRRDRLRRQTVQEIKDAALAQIAASGGAGNLSLNALAKSLGMAGPSLYRYFASRDALLDQLIADAFDSLGDALDAAVAAGDGVPAVNASATAPADRALQGLRGFAAAYRRWVLEHPELYELLFGTPVPGYHADMAQTGPAAARGLVVTTRVVERILREQHPDTVGAGDVTGPAPTPHWQAILRETDAGSPAFLVALGLWTRLHGLLTLEVRGHIGQMVTDPAALYDREVESVLRDLLPPTTRPAVR